MKKLTPFILLFHFFILLPSLVSAQLVNVWRFGNGAGLDFNTPVPTPMANSGMNSLEGTSSICDFSGNLLFYTNGNEVRSSNNVIMPNGSGLSGGTSATQTMIVPWPGQCNKYFIFQASDHTQNGDFRYSVVDMCLNNGLGDVVVGSKNIFLHNPTSEKITVVRHSNGNDYWVLTHQLGSSNFRVYPVTSAGVGTAVVTTIGSFHASNCMIGPMKASPNGQKIVVENTFCSLVEVFDFNPSTGVLSNAVSLSSQLPSGGNGYYGAEFSPNSQLLYLSSTWGNDWLIQYNLATSTQTTLASASGNYVFGGLQLGPDGKIYMVRNNQSAVDVIANPNVVGAGCNYSIAAQPLGPGTTTTMGITNFVPSLVNQSATPLQLAVDLGNDTAVSCGSFPLLLDAGQFCQAQYLWQNGATSQTIVISQPGTYYVDVTAACGIGTDTIVVTNIPQPPVAVLSGTSSICAGQSVTLSASGAISYTWPPGQGFTATYADSATASPSATTTYSVIGTGLCGTDTAYFTVNVNPLSAATAPPDTAICPGSTISLSANGANGYQWGGGSNAGTQTISVSPSVTTTYYVSSTDACPAPADTVVVTILPAVVAGLTGPSSICPGAPVVLNASGGQTYSWLNNVNGSGNTATVYPVTDSSFYVIAGNGICPDDTAMLTITVLDPTAAFLTGPVTICAGESVTLSASGTSTYTWPAGQGFTATYADSATASPSATTTYSVIGTDACGTDTAYFTVNVNPLSVATAPPDTTICPGSTISLSANGANGYQWGGGSNATTQAISISPSATTTYYVSSTNVCPAPADTIVVTVLPPVNAGLTGPAYCCSGEAILLTASGGLNYTWLNGVNGNGSNAIVSPLNDSAFSVIVSDGTCPGDTAVFAVEVVTTSQAAFSIHQSPCSNEVVFINEASGGIAFTWYFGDGQSSGDVQPSHAYDYAGTYNVTLVVNPNMTCTDSISIPVDYESIDAADIWIPNSFTPNNDTRNDVFRIYGPVECHYDHLMIFDRWGELIWETNSPMTDFWDGRVKGHIVPQGVYVYRLEGEETTERIGTVTVIR